MKKYLSFAVLTLLTTCLFSQVPDPMPNTYVNDHTGLLSTVQIDSLNKTIRAIETKSSVQIALVLVNELPERYSPEEFATAIGRKWHVGNAKNGIVYIAAINQRKMHLAPADNLSGDLPDYTCMEIMNGMKPFFKQKDYFGGLNEMLLDIGKHIDPVVKEQQALVEKEREKRWIQTKSIISNIFGVISIAAAIGLLLYFFYYRPKKKKEEQEIERKRLERDIEYEKRRKKYLKDNRPTINLNQISKPDPFLHNLPKIKETKSKQLPLLSSNKCKKKDDTSTLLPIITPIVDDTPSSSSSSSSSSSNDDNSSSYGSWGSSSSDSSSDSGFSGGGSSDSW